MLDIIKTKLRTCFYSETELSVDSLFKTVQKINGNQLHDNKLIDVEIITSIYESIC